MKFRRLMIAGSFVGLLALGACCDKQTCDDLDEWATEMQPWEQEVNDNIEALWLRVEAAEESCQNICDKQGWSGDDCPCEEPPTGTPPPPRNPPPDYP